VVVAGGAVEEVVVVGTASVVDVVEEAGPLERSWSSRVVRPWRWSSWTRAASVVEVVERPRR
jgi:hypothetical protein